MTSYVLAVLMALQIGQIPVCSVPEHGWDSTCGAMMKFCRFLSSRGHICMEFNATNNGWKCVDKEYRPRPQDLMPLVEPLPPRYKGQDARFSSFVVPAIQEEYVEWKETGACHSVSTAKKCQTEFSIDIECALMACDTIEHKKTRWTCKDKTNVLQVSEDGSGHWCVRF